MDKDSLTGAFQMGISFENQDGGGHGYRIAGAKYSGNSKCILSKEMSSRDAAEIISYLEKVE